MATGALRCLAVQAKVTKIVHVEKWFEQLSVLEGFFCLLLDRSSSICLTLMSLDHYKRVRDTMITKVKPWGGELSLSWKVNSGVFNSARALLHAIRMTFQMFSVLTVLPS